MTRSTLSQFLRFGIAGGIGFIVDVAVLYLALAAGADFYLGRGVSFLCAVFATWQVNRNFAFRPSGSMSLWQEWWRYLLAMLGGGVINYLCSALTVICCRPARWCPCSAWRSARSPACRSTSSVQSCLSSASAVRSVHRWRRVRERLRTAPIDMEEGGLNQRPCHWEHFSLATP